MIFSYLDPVESLSCRRVCWGWRQRLVGCASFSWTFASTLAITQTTINGVWLKGFRYRQDEDPGDHDGSQARSHIQNLPFSQRRTKGQLPEPSVISSRIQLFNEKPFQFCSRGKSVAIRLEEYGNNLVWDTIDFSLSACLMTRLARIQPSPGAPFALTQKRTKPLLKRILLCADLSGIQHLKRVSLRGCPHLQTLSLPSNLEALDVSSCSNLFTLSFPLGQKGKLEAMNLRGCRSLIAQETTRLFGAATVDIMRHVKDLDLSSTKRLDATALADAVSKTCNLETLSLRYVATDAVIRALADSEASKTRPTLRFVDASFSEGLTDEPCECLVNSAIYLERFNLRACGSVSSAVYNGIPVWLQNRINRDDNDNAVAFSVAFSERTTSTSQSRRKGDVVFHAVSSNK